MIEIKKLDEAKDRYDDCLRRYKMMLGEENSANVSDIFEET